MTTRLRHRSNYLAQVTVGLAAAIVIVGAVVMPASARTRAPKFIGAVPGGVSCSVSAKVSFSPPLKTSGGGTNPSKVKGTLSNCTTSNGAVTIAKGKIKGSFASSPLSCTTLFSTGVSATLNIKWKGRVNGQVGSTIYAGNAKFTPSTLSSNSEELVTNAGGNEGFLVPGSDKSSTGTGSFAGASTANAGTVDTSSALSGLCRAPKGVKKLTLTGTITVGENALWFTNSGNNSIGRIATSGAVSKYTGTSINGPADIKMGPDGALWFTNQNGSTIGRITSSGAVTNYTGTGIVNPGGITVGPDGALWFTNQNGLSIGRISTSGTVSKYTGTGINGPDEITAGLDGALWFTNRLSNSIGRITTTGVVAEHTGTGIDFPRGITVGPDGALWFTNKNNNSIGRITTAGVVTNYTGTGVSGPDHMTVGPDGALWFTNNSGNSIGRITTAGVVTDYTGTGISGPGEITVGPDGALWFTNIGGNSIGRITTAGVVTNYTGTGISGPLGIVVGP
jgi:virginiamycin B lyase